MTHKNTTPPPPAGTRQLRHNHPLPSTAVSAAREQERERLARDLHDELGAHLTAFRYVFARLEAWLPLTDPACQAMLDTTQQAYDALCEASRRVITDLHSPIIEAGLIAALGQWLDGFSAQTGLATSLVCAADSRITQLNPQAATAVFRIIQEAVNNSAKHAKSEHIDVSISTELRQLTVAVTDYGLGFADDTPSRTGHFGIDGMRERCRNLGGTLKISSEPGLSTTVSARLPWQTLLQPQA
jgi:two-component system sensor histidine kinase UhpB